VAALEMLDSTAAKAFAEKALAVDPKYAPALELRANATR
jgi:Tfp pilus assembly protein PilF